MPPKDFTIFQLDNLFQFILYFIQYIMYKSPKHSLEKHLLTEKVVVGHPESCSGLLFMIDAHYNQLQCEWKRVKNKLSPQWQYCDSFCIQWTRLTKLYLTRVDGRPDVPPFTVDCITRSAPRLDIHLRSSTEKIYSTLAQYGQRVMRSIRLRDGISTVSWFRENGKIYRGTLET